MFKKFALVVCVAATVFAAAPAYAISPGGAAVAIAGIGAVRSIFQQRRPACRYIDRFGRCIPPGRPYVAGYPQGYYGESSSVRPLERRVVTGEEMGVGAEEFPVEGIRAGERFTGVSNPGAAKQCFDRGGRLVARFAEVMPNGQSRYDNTCVPR